MSARKRPRPNVRHILSAWDSASDTERADGLLWYADARALALSLAASRGLTLETTAGVIAALSPQMSWTENVAAARLLLDGGTPRNAYGANVRKARLIAKGARPEKVLGGEKVRSFYRLIRDGGNSWDVCVDGHAYNVATGRTAPGSRVPELRYARYILVAKEYRATALRLGCGARPCDVQAVTWLAHRRRLDEQGARGRSGRKNMERQASA